MEIREPVSHGFNQEEQNQTKREKEGEKHTSQAYLTPLMRTMGGDSAWAVGWSREREGSKKKQTKKRAVAGGTLGQRRGEAVVGAVVESVIYPDKER